MSVQEVLLNPNISSTAGPSSGELGVLYEHPAWFDRLFAELDRRGIHYHKLLAPDHFYDPGARDPRLSVVFNRMSPSADRRDHGSGILYTQSWLGHLEALGTRVINGSKAFRYETSKALQLSLLHSLGLPFPKARVLHDPKHAVEASEGLRFPIVVKPNVGGSGAGIVRFDSRDDLAAAVNEGRIALGYDRVGLVQEFIPARGGHITRVETLAGKYLYAIQVHLTGETFDLCPADICQTTRGESLNNACVVEAAKAGLKVESYGPPPDVISAVERTVAAAGIQVGGIEYVIDDRDGQLYFYDVNALSNFVADAPRVIGFDPFVNLVDFLVIELEKAELASV
jgi:D-ala D-ala ligase C-terminus